MPAEQQNELFKEFERKKGSIEKIAEKITEKRKRLYVNLALENIVFAMIVVIMCVVTAFALGVERGKRLSEKADEESVGVPSVELGPIEVVSAPVEDLPEVSPAGKYTIQLISYKKEGPALREKEGLSGKKIGAFIVKSEAWYHVCAGSYDNIDGAKRALNEFKKKYKGCFIKNQ